MKYLLLLIVIFFFLACNNNKEKKIPTSATKSNTNIETDTIENFFPVTSYLRGEIYNIKTGGITPIKRTLHNKVMDSSWIKETDFESTFSAFLNPIIDTANLKNIFTEKRFLDQTLNAFTFTYDPSNNNATTFAFKHWDVYVDPQTNKVKRIYLSKTLDAETELKLFWESGKWCKIITVKTTNGISTIEKEEKISWSYEEQ